MVEGVYVGWDRIDESFSLDPTRSYLNHGGYGVTPVPVQRAQLRLRAEMETDPQRFFTRGLADRVGHTRRALADFIGADPDGAALVVNVMAGVATVLDAVHPSRTRLVVLDLIASSTARRMPVEAVASALRSTGVPLLVDAAHSPGMLDTPFDAIGADFVVGNLHKWAFAPRGTALLVVAPHWRASIRTRTVSWSQPAGFPRHVEDYGTADYTPWLAAPTGVFTLRTLGLERVRKHNLELVAQGQRIVGAALGLSADELPDPGGPVAMRVVPLPQHLIGTVDSAVALRDRISDELRFQVAVNPFRGRLLLRLAAQVYNRVEEYERLAAELPRLLNG